MTSSRTAIVMAAGKGTRMKSELPKVLVPVCGRPMIEFVYDTLIEAGVDRQIIVVGYQAAAVRQQMGGRDDVVFVDQTQQLGTGHAVMMCREQLADHDGPVLVVAGDSPLMQSGSIKSLFDEYDRQNPACLLGTGYRVDPTGLGRIVRDGDGRFVGVVEEKDASDAQRQITEVNLSCYLFNCHDLFYAVDQLGNTNAQGEYYVTDCPAILLECGRNVVALDVLKPCESLSVNTIEDLAVVEAEMRRQGA